MCVCGEVKILSMAVGHCRIIIVLQFWIVVTKHLGKEKNGGIWYSFAKTQKNKNSSGNHKAEKRRIGGKYAFQLLYSRLERQHKKSLP